MTTTAARLLFVALLVVPLAVPACGDGGGGDEDAARLADATAGPDAPPGSADAAAEASCTCASVGADYTNGVGVLSALHVPALTVERDLLPGAVSGDPVVRLLGDRVYVINRGFGGQANVTVIDPQGWTLLAQFSPGASYNPGDIAVSPDGRTGWLVGLGAGVVQVWDLSDPGSAPSAELDLSSFDADGNPDASSIALVDGRLYVALELLDENWVAAAHGKVAVLDAATGVLLTTFELTYANPFGFLRPRGDELLVATVADFGGTSGCVERIRTGSEPGAAGCLVENSALGGYVSGIAGADPAGDLFLAVAWMDAGVPKGKAVRVAGGTGAPETLTPSGQVVTEVAVCPATGHLVFTDSDVGGLRVLDPATGTELTSEPVDIGLPPAFAGTLACD